MAEGGVNHLDRLFAANGNSFQVLQRQHGVGIVDHDDDDDDDDDDARSAALEERSCCPPFLQDALAISNIGNVKSSRDVPPSS